MSTTYQAALFEENYLDDFFGGFNLIIDYTSASAAHAMVAFLALSSLIAGCIALYIFFKSTHDGVRHGQMFRFLVGGVAAGGFIGMFMLVFHMISVAQNKACEDGYCAPRGGFEQIEQ